MSASSAATAQANVLRIGHHLWAEYQKSTPKQLQLIDHFAVFAVVNGALLALYLVLNGSFPYNSFLAAFIAAVAFFIFTGEGTLARISAPLTHSAASGDEEMSGVCDADSGLCCCVRGV